jgi:hypothetical protein
MLIPAFFVLLHVLLLAVCSSIGPVGVWNADFYSATYKSFGGTGLAINDSGFSSTGDFSSTWMYGLGKAKHLRLPFLATPLVFLDEPSVIFALAVTVDPGVRIGH